MLHALVPSRETKNNVPMATRQSANPAFVMHGTGLGEEAEDAEGVIDAQIGSLALSRVDAQQVALRSLKQDDIMTAYGRRNLRLNSSSVIAVLGSRS